MKTIALSIASSALVLGASLSAMAASPAPQSAPIVEGKGKPKGQRLDRRYATNYRVVNNYRDYRLSAPPRGYQWVRSGNDAVLIAITSGLIGAVVGSAIR